MNLVILGAPGSGKGTQAELLAQKYHLTHISSGQLLRQEAKLATPKGKLVADLLAAGKLFPFQTVLDILEPALKNATSGFIIDGTPRTLSQAEFLEDFLKEMKVTLDKAIYLDIPLEVGVERIMKRAGIEHRSDDNYDSVKKRMLAYQAETMPVIDYYEKKGVLITVDGTPDVQTILTNIVNQLAVA